MTGEDKLVKQGLPLTNLCLTASDRLAVLNAPAGCTPLAQPSKTGSTVWSDPMVGHRSLGQAALRLTSVPTNPMSGGTGLLPP